ncbi:hypothetical protein BAXH7_02982 [Bacillus amyloliquefaciens XH7]|nr:hypothetical protein BAXH7_02982 [Bacillus amyloliquefaciens XH7]KYC93519.1 hypothetical protein B425_2953 [Bacillus amyloliquefaciens]
MRNSHLHIKKAPFYTGLSVKDHDYRCQKLAGDKGKIIYFFLSLSGSG